MGECMKFTYKLFLGLTIFCTTLMYQIDAKQVVQQSMQEVELMNAIKLGNPYTVSNVLKKYPNININKEFKTETESRPCGPLENESTSTTFLLEAIRVGNAPLVKMLLDKGANYNAKGYHYYTRTGVVMRQCKLHPLLSEDYYPYGEAIKLGKNDVASILVERGGNNLYGSDGNTPLISAIIKELPVATIKDMISRGAKVNYKNATGWTPLNMAIEMGNVPAIQVLLDNGADARLIDGNGTIPLFKATATGNPDIVKLLLDKGVDVNTKNNNGMTAIEMAKGNRPMVKFLLDRGATFSTVSLLK